MWQKMLQVGSGGSGSKELVYIPTLTSDNSNVNASTNKESTTGAHAWYAFSNKTENYWVGTTSNSWIQYKFESGIIPILADVSSILSSNVRLKDFKILGSNDENFATYDTLYEGTYPTFVSTGISKQQIVLNNSNNKKYKFIRLLCVNAYNNSNICVSRFQVYGLN